MIFAEKIIILKDGTEAVLRAPRKEDAPALLEYLYVTAGETEFLLRYPEECTMTVEMEEKYIETLNQSEFDIMILCEVQGRIAGNCSLSRKRHMKQQHQASVGIALYREFWGKGIGTAMFKELTDLGEKLGLKQLELEFVEGNDRGRALYEKMGFEIVAEKPDAIQQKDGRLMKLFVMIKKLEAVEKNTQKDTDPT